MYCTITMVLKLLRYSPSRYPVELLERLAPHRDERDGARVRYKDSGELRQLLCDLLEERSRSRHMAVKNSLQNWKELCEEVKSGRFFE